MSESRVRENRTHGSIGGRWGGAAHGTTEHTPARETDGTEPVYLQAHQTSGLPHILGRWWPDPETLLGTRGS